MGIRINSRHDLHLQHVLKNPFMLRRKITPPLVKRQIAQAGYWKTDGGPQES
jgi:hypothetical protein